MGYQFKPKAGPRLPAAGLFRLGLSLFPLIQIDKPALVAKLSSIQLFGGALIKHVISEETILLRIQNLLWTVF